MWRFLARPSKLTAAQHSSHLLRSRASQVYPEEIDLASQVYPEEIDLERYIRQITVMRRTNMPDGQVLPTVTEKAKGLIRSILKSIYCWHIKGVCPEQFNKEHIFVTSTGGVSLRNVGFQNKEDSMVFQNYRDASEVIRRTVFQHHANDIPDDIMHLLTLMDTKSTAISMGYVICTHASLVPMENRGSFFLRMYKHIIDVLLHDNPTAQMNIINGLPYKKDWIPLFMSNGFLAQWFKNTPTHFIRSYRNVCAHDMEHYKTTMKYTGEDVQLMLLHTFPLLLPKMQEELEKENELRDLNLDSMFGSKLPP